MTKSPKKLFVYIPKLAITVKVERINYDVETVEVHLTDDEMMRADLWEFNFDEVEFVSYMKGAKIR